MAQTTFQGPVKSINGFIGAGVGNVVSLTADTTLTVADHAGRILTTNDADGKFTLPTIVPTADANDIGTSDVTCTATYTAGNGDGTTGVATVTILYMQNNNLS